MNASELVRISCVVDSVLGRPMDELVASLGPDGALVQRGKHVCLEERRTFFGFGAAERLSGSSARLYRFMLPKDQEAAVAALIVRELDLDLPGRGFLYAQDIAVPGNRAAPREVTAPQAAEAPLEFRERRKDFGGERVRKPERYELLTCIVQRGFADPLIRSVLDLGLCVPFVTYGKGVGLRNRLGLLRITIPVDKEVVCLLVPERDSALAANLAAHTVRLDRPGQGFIFRQAVRMYAVNLRIRNGRRIHVASMEQVIGALDEIRGSSEWRRFSPKTEKPADRGAAEKSSLRCISMITEDGRINDFVMRAMEIGAGGATLTSLSSTAAKDGNAPLRSSAAREACDLIVQGSLVDPICDEMRKFGFFDPDVSGRLECSEVQDVLMYSGAGRPRS